MKAVADFVCKLSVAIYIKLYVFNVFKTYITYNYFTTSSPSNRFHPTNPLRICWSIRYRVNDGHKSTGTTYHTYYVLPWQHGTATILTFHFRYNPPKSTSNGWTAKFPPRKSLLVTLKRHTQMTGFSLSIRCQESVILVQIDQQKKRFQSDQFPFFALEFGGFPLVLLLAAYVHLYVVQIVYFLDIGFLFYRNGMDFSTLNKPGHVNTLRFKASAERNALKTKRFSTAGVTQHRRPILVHSKRSFFFPNLQSVAQYFSYKNQ